MGCSFIAPIQKLAGKVADVVLPVASVIPGPWQGAALALNAVNQASEGNILGAALSAVGAAGVSSAASAASSALSTADAAFVAADAAQLAAQGIGEAQIASILGSSGVSQGAASLAASMASNAVPETVMSQQLDNLSANTGLFSQASDAGAMQEFAQADAAQLAQQTGNNLASIEQNLISAGLDPLDAASLAQNAALASGVAPTQGMWDEFKNYLSDNPDVLNLLGKAGAVGLLSNQPTQGVQQVPAYQPLNNMPVYDPAYYQQLQNYYTGYMPNMPRDVATPLQQWYSQGYTGPDEATKKAFGG